ncbi:hypothetical protein WJX74_007197 [Apatococcus lobatus]|uniref:NAD(P)-binding domain-containing protein n=1 Tax=Apatococcus lobatus TaxID=904363 RepID=A0AAW1SC23_9CHLO
MAMLTASRIACLPHRCSHTACVCAQQKVYKGTACRLKSVQHISVSTFGARQAVASPKSTSARRIHIMAQGQDSSKVLVTGAGGKTGGSVFRKLLAQPGNFKAVAVVRSEQSAGKLKEAGAEEGAITIVDITNEADAAKLEEAMSGAHALVIATSGVPEMRGPPKEGQPPNFGWKGDQLPEQVDWEGQKRQIDAAKAAGVKQVVVVSSMGITQKENRLNTLGNGNILVWKRKAEEYLIASGLPYTIIHPGGLSDDKGGERELVLGVDDKLMSSGGPRRIPREDVAELCVQCIDMPEAINRSFDCVAREPADGNPTKDFPKLLQELQGNHSYGPLQ